MMFSMSEQNILKLIVTSFVSISFVMNFILSPLALLTSQQICSQKLSLLVASAL
ncbi:transmembrane protein, putative [Medicago truncatula]|uniref:Transmembrane protein, putative n=1 Tax=Medicago truncatula TaxID=3880 RepID=A0A072TKH4_MEDTR|nr:transmembrane protein, putative [Medicago truncatula]